MAGARFGSNPFERDRPRPPTLKKGKQMTLEDQFLSKADKDPQWAMAFAILKLANAVDRLGFNHTDTVAMTPGCLEFIGMELRDIRQVLETWDK